MAETSSDGEVQQKVGRPRKYSGTPNTRKRKKDKVYANSEAGILADLKKKEIKKQKRVHTLEDRTYTNIKKVYTGINSTAIKIVEK